MNDQVAMTDDDLRDARLAHLLEDLLTRSSKGERIDIARVAEEHPELAVDLRILWGTANLVNAVGDQALRDSVGNPLFEADDTGPSLSALELPCRFGDYELLEEIGRGGMGVVFRARQVTLDRVVAIKMLLRGSLASGEDVDRFRREAQAVAQMAHPNILPIFDFGEHDGRMYFTMPLIQGETLAQRLARGRLPSRRAAKLLSAICHAVHHAHEQGVLHRDLKPSNILIDTDGTPYVTDFGLARPDDDASMSLTKSGAVVGTPAFMSPEQAGGQSQQIGPASDVYSLGSVLYNAITGQPPFAARSTVELIMKVIEEEPLPPRNLESCISKSLEMVAMRCLQKPVDLRYASAGELADDLDAFLRNEPVGAGRGRVSEIVARMFRETHHAPILQNWGGLWMLNGIFLFIAAIVSDTMRYQGVTNRLNYFAFWSVALIVWASIYAMIRRRMGSVTFVERQIAHVWAAGLVIIFTLMPLEYLVGLELFQLSPLLATATGVAFLVKAGSLSGTFYIQAGTLFALSFVMAVWPTRALSLFGLVVGICFVIPGWKNYQLRKSQVALDP